ncbi:MULTISPECIES: hypothetical protein [Luteimonas]|nr:MULTISPECIES: hypothetical protein [Luteimonas]
MQTQTLSTRQFAAVCARPFGTGYGRSSGYAAPRSYTASTVPARFRVA